MTLSYRLFGYFIRRDACRMTAQALHGLSPRWDSDDIAKVAWCLTVFFESYLVDGAKATKEDFGPKEPVNLSVVTTPTHQQNPTVA